MATADTRNAIILAGIRRYADWDKSDPFTYQRCLTHLRQGLCRPMQDGTNGHYEAQQTVTSEGVTVWSNIKRI